MEKLTAETSEIQIPQKKIGRRSLIRGAVGLAAAAAVGGEIKKEIGHGEGREIKTRYGIFIPLYEVHDKGIDPQDIPEDADIFFDELVTQRETLFEQKAEKILKSTRYYRGDLKVNEGDVLSILAKRNVEVMFGDIHYVRKLVEEYEDQIKRYALLGTAGGITRLTSEFVTLFINKFLGKKISRRNLLNKVATGTFLWGATSIIPRIVGVEAGISLRNSRVEKAIKNITYRIAGLGSEVHPEEFIIFFRSLLMAEKLLAVAEEESRRKGRKVKIAFNVGGLHSSVEDFFVLGRSFCQTLISIYPKNLLEEAIRACGGLNDFCSSRLLKFSGQEVDFDKIEERRFVDRELLEKLKPVVSPSLNN